MRPLRPASTCRAEGAVLLLAIFALPLWFFPWGYDQYVLPKTSAATALAALLAAWALGRALTPGGRVGVALTPTNALLALFVLLHGATIPFAESPSLAIERTAWLGAALVLSWRWQEWAGSDRRRLLRGFLALAASGVATAGWALWDDLSAKGFLPASTGGAVRVNRLGDWRGAIAAGLGNTDHIAMLLAMLVPPLLLFTLRRRRAGAAAAGLGALWVIAAAMMVCWSVGNNAALILTAALLVLAMGRRARRRLRRGRSGRRLVLWAAGSLLAVLWLTTNTPLNPHRPGLFQEAFSSPRWIAGGPTRGVIWLNTMEMIRRNQLLGVGAGNFTFAYPRMQSEFVPREPEWLVYQGAYTNAAHNTLMQVWAETGPLGALLFAALFVRAFVLLWAAARRGRAVTRWTAWGALGMLGVWALSSLMTFPLQLPAPTVVLFLLLPAGEMLRAAERRREREAMPGFVDEGAWFSTSAALSDLRTPVRLEVSAHPPRWAAVAAGTALVLAGLAGAGWSLRPLASDALYQRARTVRALLPAEADPLFQRALAVWPNHHDCRSAYSDYLLAQGRPAECLTQLERVFERLDSAELHLRRARALRALGREAEAAAALRTYFERRPFAAMNPRPEAAP